MHLIQTPNPMHLVLFYGEMQIFGGGGQTWGSRMKRNKNNGKWIKNFVKKEGESWKSEGEKQNKTKHYRRGK